MSEMRSCQGCAYKFKHEWEIYGAVGDSLCADCYFDMISSAQGYEEWYGLAPHGHDMNRTGSIIGSTVFKPLPDKVDENGWYDLGNGTFFWPDPEVGPYMGIWRRYGDVWEKPDAPYMSECNLNDHGEW